MYPFIGLSDIVSQVSDLKKGLSHFGIKSYACVLEPFVHSANIVDKTLATGRFSKVNIRPQLLQDYLRFGWKRETALKKAVKENDIFIFVWQTFKDDCSDLAFLKDKDKKIIVFFMGSEQRWSYAYKQEVEKYGIPNYYSRFPSNDFQLSYKALRIKLRYLRNVEKYADIIYSLPNQSQLSLKPYSHFYIPVDTEIISEKPQQRKIPIIAHAPTKRSVKGTDIVLEAFEKLKNKGIKFESRLIENMPYFEALMAYAESDIVIGELYIPSAGKLDREALAAGKVVLSSVRRDYIDNLPSDCPIIDVNPQTLFNELEKIIPDYTRRVELAKMGRPFVEKYHDIRVICRDMLQKLENLSDEKNFEFYPQFFRKEFVPESLKHCQLYNYWTQFVSTTDWYKKYVPPGERANLIF